MSVVLAVLVACALADARADDGRPAPQPAAQPELRRTLPNGVEVVVLPSARARAVALLVGFRTGARDESPAEAGSAHLAMRLTRRAACGEWARGASQAALDELATAAGTLDGAGADTLHELTYFHATATEDALPRLLDVARDRWTSLAPDQALFDEELKGAVTELAFAALRRENRAQNALAALAFGECGLGRNRLGTGTGFDRITLASVEAWRRARYRPDRAIVVVAGARDAQGALDKVAAKLGSVAAPDGPAPRPGAVPAPAKGPLRATIEGPAAARELLIGFRGPEAGSDDEAAFLLAAYHVKDRMVEKLRGIAKDVNVHADPRGDAPALLAVTLVPRPSASIAEVDSGASAALAACRAEAPRDLTRLRTKVSHFLTGLTAPLDASTRPEHPPAALLEAAIDRAVAHPLLARREALARRLASLEPEAFLAAMKRLLAEERACYVAVGPDR